MLPMHRDGFVKILEWLKISLEMEIVNTVFIGACNYTRRTFGANLPQMGSTKLFLLNMQKDLKQ